jgi:hypothetical protein
MLPAAAASAQGLAPAVEAAESLCPPTRRVEWAGASLVQKRAMIRTCARISSQGAEAAAWAFRRPLVVVLDLEPSEPALGARAAELTRDLTRALAASPRVEAVGARSFARLRAMGPCAEAPDCLADVVAATEAAFVLSGRVGRESQQLRVELAVRQARGLELAGTRSRLLSDASNDGVAAQELALASLRLVTSVTLEEPELVASASTVERGSELVGRAASPAALLHPPPWGLWAASLGAMALGGVLLFNSFPSTTSTVCCASSSDSARVANDLGVALLAIGGGALTASLLWVGGSRFDDPRLLLSIAPTGSGFALGGVF